jgi:hypothetical protein
MSILYFAQLFQSQETQETNLLLPLRSFEATHRVIKIVVLAVGENKEKQLSQCQQAQKKRQLLMPMRIYRLLQVWLA